LSSKKVDFRNQPNLTTLLIDPYTPLENAHNQYMICLSAEYQ